MGSVVNVVSFVESLKNLLASVKDDPSYSPNQRRQIVAYLKAEIQALFDSEGAT